VYFRIFPVFPCLREKVLKRSSFVQAIPFRINFSYIFCTQNLCHLFPPICLSRQFLLSSDILSQELKSFSSNFTFLGTMCQFWQHFMCIFCEQRSQKHKKAVKSSVSFALLGSLHVKAASKTLVKSTICRPPPLFFSHDTSVLKEAWMSYLLSAARS